MNNNELRWFAARLSIAVYDTNQASRRRDHRMSVEVKGLADTVRSAKLAISKASDAAARMQQSAQRLTGTLVQVEEMTAQLDGAHAELQAAVGTLSNGGPPLDSSAAGAPDVQAGTAEGGLRAVQIANRDLKVS